MRPGKFRALLDSVEMGSFSKAAEKSNYSQSGLTHMMNSLEAEIGFPLLHRGKYGIRLTTEGERLLPFIRNYVNAEKSLIDEVDRMNKEKTDNLCIGTIFKHGKKLDSSYYRRAAENFP